MTSLLTYGSMASDFLGILRQSTFGGGTLDGNFLPATARMSRFSFINSREPVHQEHVAGRRPLGQQQRTDPSGGGLDSNVKHARDVSYVTVTGITNANPAVVTTQWDHGYATGRVIRLSASAA